MLLDFQLLDLSSQRRTVTHTVLTGDTNLLCSLSPAVRLVSVLGGVLRGGEGVSRVRSEAGGLRALRLRSLAPGTVPAVEFRGCAAPDRMQQYSMSINFPLRSLEHAWSLELARRLWPVTFCFSLLSRFSRASPALLARLSLACHSPVASSSLASSRPSHRPSLASIPYIFVLGLLVYPNTNW